MLLSQFIAELQKVQQELAKEYPGEDPVVAVFNDGRHCGTDVVSPTVGYHFQDKNSIDWLFGADEQEIAEEDGHNWEERGELRLLIADVTDACSQL